MVSIPVSQFDDNSVVTVQIEGQEVVVFKIEEDYFALNNRCSHAEASLSEGEVYDCKVECPLHGAEFDLKTGEPLTLPATKPVKVYDVLLQNDQLIIQDKHA
ncbi:MAG: non-heme iron oxygenase ferredoxin subunit [Actinomycetota bacterium]|nr:non-heme iron oxygenase ferredoxin subunit [Actinomycetota bacterium]MDA3013510.1 non-heme iron oxygenase ferredoxin subunit [Actinomycetota bacterium]